MKPGEGRGSLGDGLLGSRSDVEVAGLREEVERRALAGRHGVVRTPVSPARATDMASLPRPLPKSLDAFCRAARDFSVEALAEVTVADLVRGALVSAGTPRQRHSPLQPLFMC